MWKSLQFYILLSLLKPSVEFEKIGIRRMWNRSPRLSMSDEDSSPTGPELMRLFPSRSKAKLHVEERSDDVQSKTVPPLGVIRSLFILNSVAILWGTQHAVIKMGVDYFPSTSTFIMLRFFFSAMIFAPAIAKVISERKIATFRAGSELGLFTFLGFAFQAVGLEITTANRSAFLLYLNVKFVPFLAAVFLGRKIDLSTWLSAFLAFSGTCLLSTDGGPLNVGDLWSIAAAIASAAFILKLERFSNRFEAAELNGATSVVVFLLSVLWVVCDGWVGQVHSADIVVNHQTNLELALTPFWDAMEALLSNPWPILYLGGITTALCGYLQTLGQRTIPAERAAIIYSLDPVYGAFFSRLLLGERLGTQGYIGALLILLGVWASLAAVTDRKQDSSGTC